MEKKMKVSIKNKNNTTWFVVALEEEFSSDKHNVLYTGMGKINAAMSVQWLIDNFNVKKIINVGSAGGNPNKVDAGRVYNIGTTVDRDWCFPDSGCVTVLTNNDAGQESKTCFTGDSFVTDWNNDYEIVDMEAFAIAKVCNTPENNVQFSCYKYISDNGSGEDWRDSLIKCNKIFNEMFD